MKTIILTLVLFFLFITPLSAQWEIINDGSGLKGSLNAIDFVNENIGWIAGSNGTLLNTTDGGENWNSISINDGWNINQIDFINELTGWAIGGRYIEPSWTNFIWKTQDGGQSWSRQFSSTEFGFSSLYVIDVNNVFAVGGNKIYKTSNGGTNWINVAPSLPNRNYNSVWFQDSQTGVVVGNYNDGITDRAVILKTTNGGTTWTETIVNEFNSIYDLQFLDATNGYFRANKDTAHFICKTVDMFTSCNVITQVILPNSSKNPMPSYQFINNNLAYAILDTSGSYRILETTDGGANWHTVQTLNYSVSEIYIIGNNSGYVLGGYWGSSFLFRSEDLTKWDIQIFSYPLKDISFVNLDRGIIVGSFGGGHYWEGIILLTNNCGSSWDIVAGALTNSCFFLDEQVAFTLSDRVRFYFYKSTDSGNNWTRKTFLINGEYYNGNDICFTDANTGWVAGSNVDNNWSCILLTTDQGETWEVSYVDNSGLPLYAICFTGTTGWSVGEGGGIYKYTPQTGWIQQTYVTDLPLNKVFFSDENHGWISGGYQNENNFQNILLKTTNGGVNWTTVPNIPYLFRDIAFIDNNRGWAIGYTETGDGGILETVDGGITWSIDTGNLPAKLNALHIKDNYGWAVGENGLILRTTDAGAVPVEDENNNVYPTEFVLEQNYPNPFNPGTVIRYSLSVNSFVRLKVYDILGREIKTLVNEEQPAGRYEVQLTINDEPLTSGVYLYRLTAGSYTATKKMLLLK